MAINIFDVQNDTPKVTFDVVGRFRAGHMIGKRPQSLHEWRVTSDDKEVVEAVTEIYGGTAQDWDNEKQPFEAFTDAKSLDIIVERIFSGMTLWGRAGAIHRCDGETITYPEEQAGQKCNMAGRPMSERKSAAQAGTGCAPDVTVRFRLAANPELGVFEFKSGSWNLARDIGKAESDLAKFGGKAKGTLTLEPVEWTDKASGQTRKFVKSVVVLTEAAE